MISFLFLVFLSPGRVDGDFFFSKKKKEKKKSQKGYPKNVAAKNGFHRRFLCPKTHKICKIFFFEFFFLLGVLLSWEKNEMLWGLPLFLYSCCSNKTKKNSKTWLVSQFSFSTRQSKAQNHTTFVPPLSKKKPLYIVSFLPPFPKKTLCVASFLPPKQKKKQKKNKPTDNHIVSILPPFGPKKKKKNMKGKKKTELSLELFWRKVFLTAENERGREFFFYFYLLLLLYFSTWKIQDLFSPLFGLGSHKNEQTNKQTHTHFVEGGQKETILLQGNNFSIGIRKIKNPQHYINCVCFRFLFPFSSLSGRIAQKRIPFKFLFFCFFEAK